MLIGEFTSLDPAHIRRVSTRVDKYEVPYFLLVYSNGDKEYFSAREAQVTNINGTEDSKLCLAINAHYFS